MKVCLERGLISAKADFSKKPICHLVLLYLAHAEFSRSRCWDGAQGRLLTGDKPVQEKAEQDFETMTQALWSLHPDGGELCVKCDHEVFPKIGQNGQALYLILLNRDCGLTQEGHDLRWDGSLSLSGEAHSWRPSAPCTPWSRTASSSLRRNLSGTSLYLLHRLWLCFLS